METGNLEQWQPITGYNGYYEVSNLGKVRSLERTVSSTAGKSIHVSSRIMKLKAHSKGYQFVQLSKNGAKTNHYVHRLVATAFVLNPNFKPEVNHTNGIKTDNRATNLDWVTRSENINHALRTGLNRPEERHVPQSIPLIDLATQVQYGSIKEAARHYGMNYDKLKSQLRRGTCQLPIKYCGRVAA